MKTLKEWDAKPGDMVTAISMINTGHIIENGSSWIIKRFDGDDYFGVLAHYKDDHKGVRLSNCHLWNIKRAPNVEVYVRWHSGTGDWSIFSDRRTNTHMLTYNKVNGEIDCNSVKMVKL